MPIPEESFEVVSGRGDRLDTPAVSPRLYLVDCSEPEEKIKANWPRFYEYLQKGREEGIHAS
jgi:hypothetical protein